MAQRKFKLPTLTNNGEENTVKMELDKMEEQKIMNVQLVLWSKLRPSEMNQFEKYKTTKPDKYKEIKDSIRTYGLIEPLVIIPIDDPTYEYEILGGEHRYHMIGELLEEGDPRFKNGIPCNIQPKTLAIVDRQIIIELGNISGHNDPSEVRKSVGRLTDLYQQKNKEHGTNLSITKQVAGSIDLSEREVQRYKSISEKLIPELQEAFDHKKLSLERAASMAALPLETQKDIFEFLKEKLEQDNSISPLELQTAKKAAEEKGAELKRLQKELEKAQDESRSTSKQLEESKSKITEMKEQESNLREEIKKELEKEKQDDDAITKLQVQLESISTEKKSAEEAKSSLENEVKKLKKEIKKLEKSRPSLTQTTISEEERLKIEDSIKVTTAAKDMLKRFNLFETELEHYKTNYPELPSELIDIIKRFEETKKRIDSLL